MASTTRINLEEPVRVASPTRINLEEPVRVASPTRIYSLRVGWRNLPTLCVGWRNLSSSCAVVSVLVLAGNSFWCYVHT